MSTIAWNKVSMNHKEVHARLFDCFIDAIEKKDMILAKFFYDKMQNNYYRLIEDAKMLKPSEVEIIKNNKQWEEYADARMYDLASELNSGADVDGGGL